MIKNKYSSLWLSLACFIIFILQSIFPIITSTFKLTTSEALTHPWTLLTAIFLHGSLVHLLYNLFALVLFGLILEGTIGTKKFLILFFSAGLFASIASIPFYNAVLGASGAIFGIIGALAIIKPKMVVWVYGMPMPMFLAALIWAIVDVLGIFIPSNIANLAHLFGILIGIVFGAIFRAYIKESLTKQQPSLL